MQRKYFSEAVEDKKKPKSKARKIAKAAAYMTLGTLGILSGNEVKDKILNKIKPLKILPNDSLKKETLRALGRGVILTSAGIATGIGISQLSSKINRELEEDKQKHFSNKRYGY